MLLFNTIEGQGHFPRQGHFLCMGYGTDPINALRSENGVEVTGSPSELRWPLVCVGVVMGPSLPKFMVLW